MQTSNFYNSNFITRTSITRTSITRTSITRTSITFISRTYITRTRKISNRPSFNILYILLTVLNSNDFTFLWIYNSLNVTTMIASKHQRPTHFNQPFKQTLCTPNLLQHWQPLNDIQTSQISSISCLSSFCLQIMADV